MDNIWVKQNNNFFLGEISDQVKILEPSVYKLEFHQKERIILIPKLWIKFSFPYKIYGIEDNFINRVVKTYHNTQGNLGVLLNGVKGTGKTVTAELICNKLNLPVIIISENYEEANIPSFINNIQQDIILFFDEYEKVFEDYSHSILTIMDGVMSNTYRKVFLLTTNTLWVNDNMLSRPSRIRYVKQFKDLSIETITEIIDDKLKYPKI